MSVEPSLDKAIKYAKFLGELLWKNAFGVYQLIDLEQALLERFERMSLPERGSQLCRYGHVLTKAYDTGGHTRLVERLVGSVALEDSAVIVLTSVSGLAAQRLRKARHGVRRVKRHSAGRARVIALLEEFLRYETLVLYIHPHDIEAALAAGLAKKHAGVRVLLFNHADHVFTFGLSVADRVLEISHFGWQLRGMRKTIDRSLFVGIPLDLPGNRDKSCIYDGPVVAAGTAYKFRPALDWSFPAFAQALCRRVKRNVHIVGPRIMVDWWWWRSQFALGRRLTLHRRLGHADYLAFISGASAYVDSFPFVGGTAFAEVMGKGISCFGVLTGTHGYSPADLLKSTSIEKLLDALTYYIQSGSREALDEDDIYRQMLAVHAVERVAERVAGALTAEVGVPPPWPCVKDIDVTAFERIWLERMIPIFPVCSLIMPRMMAKLLFIKFFFRSARV
ncbi:hypothetical protein P0Y43_03875 [Pseudomonas entomophila]|uniref:hypothetical protein n=1 Tax=Pseudomonas entomophila TaxID=312306 RepID=UPI0023D84E3C|nr:hypothetical protein [Pseudomonas entomophila]MDF0729867.1 hypothetical protein [Pseudomonas entomophila]